MCTLALYFRQLDSTPLMVAANRDEFYSRPSVPPQALLYSPLIYGGKDLRAGGTWLGVNQHGLLVGILNRRSDGASDRAGNRSRGLLCLDILKAPNPMEATELLRRERASAYLPFNLLIANRENACVAYNQDEKIEMIPLDQGIHVISNTSIFDPRTEKMNLAYRLFLDAATRLREAGGSFTEENSAPDNPGEQGQPPWLNFFKAALSSHQPGREAKDPRDAICVHADQYGTVSSSIIFYSSRERQFHYYHAPSAPCRSEFVKYPSLEVL